MRKKTKSRRDDTVVSSYFDWQKRFRGQLLEHPAIHKNPRLFCLGFILSDMFDYESFDCYPTRETLAERLGVSVTQVSALTNKLEQIGFLNVKRRRNTSALYGGKLPQEVNSGSHPEDVTAAPSEDQEIKPSVSRKASTVDFGKSSGLASNIPRDTVPNEGGGAHAPAANSCQNSFSLDDLGGLSRNAIIPPDAAKAARAEIIEHFVSEIIVDAHQTGDVKERARSRIGNLLDRGSLTKRRAEDIVDEINMSNDAGGFDERSA